MDIQSIPVLHTTGFALPASSRRAASHQFAAWCGDFGDVDRNPSCEDGKSVTTRNGVMIAQPE